MPGGLGYTYPNPMQLKDKLWLFWRGGAWNPTFSYTEDGIHWVPARELVYFGHAQRPYTKYVTDGNAGSTASSPTATRRTGRTASTTRATRTRRSTR